jgi:hypothetical protein
MATQPDPTPDPTDTRLTHLESQLRALTAEIRTHRLVVEDQAGEPRLTAEVVGSHVELRLLIPGTPPGYSSSVLIYAAEGSPEGSPALGLQLWADGDARAGIDAWEQSDGRWEATVQVDEQA